MKKYLLWLKRLWAWLKEWRFCFYGLTLPGTSLLFFKLFACSASDIVRVGCLLQLYAIGTVVYDIQSKLKQFGHKSLVDVWLERIHRFPKITPPSIVWDVHMTEPMAKMTGSASIKYNLNPGTVQERLEMLENMYQKLEERQDSMFKSLDLEILRVKREIDETKQTLEGVDQETIKQVVELATGSLAISGMGISWLFCGVIFSSTPELILTILSW